jgi:hypothetical protein
MIPAGLTEKALHIAMPIPRDIPGCLIEWTSLFWLLEGKCLGRRIR